MKHARYDYNRIQDPSGKIPEDEPVFLLRAQDPIAYEIVSIYAQRAEEIGADPLLVEAARQHSAAMWRWPTKKACPDMPEQETDQ